MRRKNSLVTIIFVVLLAGVGYAFAKGMIGIGKNNGTGDKAVGGGSPEMEKQAETKGNEQVKNEFSGEIIYLEKSSDRSDIYNLNVANNEKKIVFTDADESLKIKQGSNLTRDTKEAIVLLAGGDQMFGGSLDFISLDGKGTKKEIEKDFASPIIPSISPDGQSIAGVIFSNAESNFGFTLYAENLSAKTKREIAKDASGISLISWSPSGERIAFVKGGTADKNEIMTADKDGNNLKAVFQSKGEAISGLVWKDDNTILVIAGKEIFQVDLKSGKETKIKSSDKNKRSLIISPDQNSFAYLELDTLNSIEGKIVLVNFIDGTSKTFGPAQELMGWIK